MSVYIPEFKTKYRSGDTNDIYSYGMAFTSIDLDGAVSSLSAVFPKMIRLAEIEKSCQLMADEIEKTRRRVNALEHIMIPDYEETIKFITMKLSENERSTTTSLMKVKDMVLKQSHHYQQ
jgi:V/A-type H+-transporting ATPase subunit D